MRQIKEAAAIVIALAIVFCATYVPAFLLTPVRTGYGAVWDLYRQEDTDSIDVLYLGSSMVYCDMIPAVVWEETGLSSFVMAGPGQTMSFTYYYLQEACKTQSPQAVVLELSGMFFARYEGHTKSNITYMPWTMNRIRATLRAAEPEQRLGAFFPIYNYHDRVYTVTPGELRARLFPGTDLYAGYTLLTTASEQTGYPARDYSTDTEDYRSNLDYLEKIAAFCAEEDIPLVLYLAPVHYLIPEDTLRTLEQDVSAVPHALYFNCNDGTWPAYDPVTDWYDAQHLNVYGAIPFSRQFGQTLMQLGLQPGQHDPALWQARLDAIQKYISP